MKLPKTVMICGMKYKVRHTHDKGHCGGWGDTGTQEIGVNSDGHSDEKVFQTFMHEVMEIVACERGVHYTSHQSERLISMTHSEFDVFSADIAAIVKSIMRFK